MLVKKINILILICCFLNTAAQSLVSGTVKTQTGEALNGATVQLINLSKIELTNELGEFRFELDNKAEYLRFVISYVGCASFDTICIQQNQKHQFELNCGVFIDEMVVKAFYPVKRNAATVLKLNDLKKQPVLLGEPDIFKTLQTKPGIDFGTEGSGDMVVRGGSISENLILLDNLPVFSSSHLFGLLTPFDAELVSEIQVYKNGFPAKYGGRLSAVVDIKSKNFEDIKPALEVRTGILSTGLYYADQLGDKVKFNLSLRRTLLDGFAALYSVSILDGQEKIIPSFSDAFFKLATKPGENHALSLSAVYSSDRFLQGIYIDNTNETYINEGTTSWRTPMITLQYDYKKEHTAFNFGIGKSLYNYKANSIYQDFQALDSLEETFSHRVKNDLNILSASFVQKIKSIALSAGSTYTIKDYRFNTKEISNTTYLTNDSLSLKNLKSANQ